MKYVGIDNGLNGGIIALDDNQKIIGKWIMPTIKVGGKTEYNVRAVSEILSGLAADPPEVFVVLEKSHVRPVSGKRASFMTGFGYGLMQGILETLGLSYEIVSPQVWQKSMLGKTRKDSKGLSILFCQRKYPDTKWTATDKCIRPHDGLTDAGTMAVYAYRRYKVIG